MFANITSKCEKLLLQTDMLLHYFINQYDSEYINTEYIK